MKVFKKVLIVIAALFVVLLVVALFAKKEYTVEREITINRPKQEVFNYVKYVENQRNYSKWVMLDPNVRFTHKGTDGTVGYQSTWESDKDEVGKGEQQITAIKEGERADVALHFIKPFEGKATAYTTTDAISDSQTKVKWVFNSKIPYPMNLMMVFVDIPEMLGKDMDTSLVNLKTVLERNR